MSTTITVPTIPDPTALTVISTDTEIAVHSIVAQAVLLPDAIAKTTDAIMCRSIMNQAGALFKAIDTQRKKISDPYEQAKKKIIAAAKEPLDTLEQVVDGCKALLAGYVVVTEAENKRAEEARQALEAASPTDARPTPALVLNAPEQKPIEVVPMTTVRDLEIVDEALIPDSYYVLDRVRLRKDVLGGVAVAGCRIRTDQMIANR